MLAWICLCLHRKRVLSSAELGRNPARAGAHSAQTASGPSEHLSVVFLEERAISEIIYLTGIKLVHYSSLEFLRIKSYHSISFARGALSSLPDDPQSSVLWGVFRWAKALPRLSCSRSSWTNPLLKILNEVALKSYETWWPLITPLVQCWTSRQTPQWKLNNSH